MGRTGITFYTLIHISRDEQSIHNNAFVKSFKDQINLYFSCARQLHRSLKEMETELIILTNDKAFLWDLNETKYDIKIVQLDFILKVPSGLKFYSAHYKLEVYNYLASLSNEYVGLIDCDIVCVNNMPESFHNAIFSKTPLYYDITNQMAPAYGQEAMIAEKQKLGDRKSLGLWAGGEFITGTPEFFKSLYLEVEGIKGEYFRNFNNFKIQGDEMLTSVAIENMMNNGVNIMDAGTFSIIARFWSYKPLHTQKAIVAYKNYFLLHLPSDKRFITGLREDELKADRFFSMYRNHVLKSRFFESAIKRFKPYFKKARKKLMDRNR